jgi:hypothetical protein
LSVYALDVHPETGVVSHCRPQERDGALGILGRQEPGIGYSRGVVDRDVQVISAGVPNEGDGGSL